MTNFSIDRIKLLFDKNIYCSTWAEIIKSEIFRQRDKSNNNASDIFIKKFFGTLKVAQFQKQAGM